LEGAVSDRLAEARAAMVAEQIVARGMRDERVARAMRAVPRELFVAEAVREFAYADTVLLIEKQQNDLPALRRRGPARHIPLLPLPALSHRPSAIVDPAR
jgi:hypothetical protein